MNAEIVEVPIDKVRRSPFQFRKDLTQLETITDASDVLLPLLVRPVDGAYELIDGEGRLERLKRLGAKSVRVESRPMDDKSAALAVLRINIERGSPTEEDKARALVIFMKTFGSTLTEAAEAAHMSKGAASSLNAYAEAKGWLRVEEVPTRNPESVNKPLTRTKLDIIKTLPMEKRKDVIRVVEEANVSTSDTHVVVAKVRGGKDALTARTEVENWKDSHRQEEHQDRRRIAGKKAPPARHHVLCLDCGDRPYVIHEGPHQHRLFEEGGQP